MASVRRWQRVVAVGEELLGRQTAEGVEFAALLDVATGHHAAPIVRGQPTSVDTSSQLAAMQAGRAYVQVHTHPSEATFSLDDAAVLAFHPGVRTSVVLAAGHWRYVLSVMPGEYPSPISRIYQAYRAAYELLLPAFADRLERGELGVAEAGFALHREVWRTIASGMRVVYDQIEVR